MAFISHDTGLPIISRVEMRSLNTHIKLINQYYLSFFKLLKLFNLISTE